MNWLLELFYDAIFELIVGMVTFLGGLVNNIFGLMYLLSSKLSLGLIREYTVGIGISLVVIFSIKQGIDVYVLKTEGDPDADPLELFTRIAQTIATITCGNWVIQQLIYYATVATQEISSKLSVDTNDVSITILSVVNGTSAMVGIAALIYMVIYAIMVITLFIMVFMAAKRAAELEWFRILLPIMAVNMITTSRERWNSFRTELVICIFGYIAQVVSFNVFVMILKQVANNPTNIFLLFAAIGWLMIVVTAPKWLEKISYSSGVGNATKGGARSALNVLPSIMMKIK